MWACTDINGRRCLQWAGSTASLPSCHLCCCYICCWHHVCLQVRDKLAKLVNVRRHKMEEGLHQIGSTATVRVNGLGAYELNLIRANFQGALNMFLKLETVSSSAFSAGGCNFRAGAYKLDLVCANFEGALNMF